MLHDPETARSARLHHSVRPGRFRHRHRVHQRAAQERHHGPPRHRGVHGGGQELSRGFVRGEDRAGLPPARAGHVRAAGSSQRFRAIPAARPMPPYDITGWTLAMQMGVKYDRILDGFDGPFTKVNGLLPPPRDVGQRAVAIPPGYLISHRINNSFMLVNRLLKASAEVYWLKAAGKADGAGSGHGHDLGAGFGRRAAGAREGREGSRRAGARGGQGAGGRRPEAQADPHRSVRSVRRVDALRLDALAVRAVRIPVRGGLSADARRRRSEEQVRRAGVHRRRDPRGGAGGRGGGAGRLRRRGRSGEHSGGVSRDGSAASPTTRRCPQLKKFVESRRHRS